MNDNYLCNEGTWTISDHVVQFEQKILHFKANYEILNQKWLKYKFCCDCFLMQNFF